MLSPARALRRNPAWDTGAGRGRQEVIRVDGSLPGVPGVDGRRRLRSREEGEEEISMRSHPKIKSSKGHGEICMVVLDLTLDPHSQAKPTAVALPAILPSLFLVLLDRE